MKTSHECQNCDKAMKRIRDLLFLEEERDGTEFYNPTKDCDSDIIGEIVNTVTDYFGGYDELFKDTPEEYREFE